jgi:hypothetical protein
MNEIQKLPLAEKNYTQASYNVRNVYFLDDLRVGEEQMKHTEHEPGIPRYLHMLQLLYASSALHRPQIVEKINISNITRMSIILFSQ